MAKLRHRLKWALTVEQWRTIHTAGILGLMTLGACASLGVVHLWASLWGDVNGPFQLFVWTVLGALFVTVSAIAWLLLVGGLYVLLFPVKAMKNREKARGGAL